MPPGQVNVRYMVEDVDAAIEFYTKHLGFTLGINASPAFADVTRETCDYYSAAGKARREDQCQMELYLFPVGGTVLNWCMKTWLQK